MRIIFLAPLALLTACDFGEIGLGGDETDTFKIADSSATTHLGDAIEGGNDLTFQQLFEQGDGVVFKDTPDPSALLTATNAIDDDLDRSGRAPLSVLSYNIALLDVKLLGFIPYAQTPDLEARRRASAGRIFERGADIVLLQELWIDQDVEEFIKTGEELGYRGFVQDRDGHNDGLGIFIKETAIAGGTSTDVDFAAYGAQNGQEYFPGPGIQRGWLSVSFTHPEIGRIHAFDTHMQAYPENWLGRMKQGREIGIIMRQIIDDEETGDDLVLVGGDFNAGPYYKDAKWTVPDGSVQDRWFHNTLSYPVMLTYADMVDLAIMGRPAADAIADVTLGNTVVNDAEKSATIPGAEEGWCDRTPITTFSASDCNTLYFAQYAGTEYPARLDHIFGHNTDGTRIVVAKSELVFTETQPFGDTEVEQSDHYGVAIDMLVTPGR
ncbi:MAG: endonuclease/exonuclease/phosphatase family protein [Deltaproteobacteria bacterium]|nr:endonuclease/exonuclease/phosphatase family protein [Deltaproteobacteria bacterium]